MKFRHQISITSETGVGKSSLIKVLRDKLPKGTDYRWVSVGGIMRARAKDFGMTIEEFANHNRLHPEEGHDQWCDQKIVQLGRYDWMICEGRLPHFFLPGAFKILLVCDPVVRAKRRQKDFPDKSFEAILQDIKDRDYNDRLRYEALYPGCLWRADQFHDFYDTSEHSPEEIAEKLIISHQSWVSTMEVTTSV